MSSTRVKFETFTHKREEIVPGIEQEVPQQGFDVVKESLALAQRLAQEVIFFIHQAHDGVKEKGEQVQTQQHGR